MEELNIAVQVDEKSGATVMAIFTKLQQVLLNFAINAEQSNAPIRRVILRTGDRAAPTGGAVFFFELPIVSIPSPKPEAPEVPEAPEARSPRPEA